MRLRNYGQISKLTFFCLSGVVTALFLVGCNLPAMSHLHNSNDPLSSNYTGGTPHYVIYNMNGAVSGAAPIDPTGYVAGANVVLAGNSGSMVKSSFPFAGWNTVADGSGTCYAPGAIIPMGNANITLYALWYTGGNYTLTGTGQAGGYVFYDSLLTTGTLFRSNGSLCRYLEAAPVDQALSIVWTTGAIASLSTGMGVGDGFANTQNIYNALGTGSYAADICRAYILNGWNDWYLPSKAEADLLYANLIYPGFGSFQSNTYYWTSSQFSSSNSYTYYTASPISVHDNITVSHAVRAIRAYY